MSGKSNEIEDTIGRVYHLEEEPMEGKTQEDKTPSDAGQYSIRINTESLYRLGAALCLLVVCVCLLFFLARIAIPKSKERVPEIEADIQENKIKEPDIPIEKAAPALGNEKTVPDTQSGSIVDKNNICIPLYGNNVSTIKMPETGRRDPFVSLLPKARHNVSIKPGKRRIAVFPGIFPIPEGMPLIPMPAKEELAANVPAKEEVNKESKPANVPILKAVLCGDNGSLAIVYIDDKHYKVGVGSQLPGGYNVKDIRNNAITLQKEAEETELKL